MLLTLCLASTLQFAAAQTPAPQSAPHDAIVGIAPAMQAPALDDGVPLPQAAQWRATATGDVLVAPAQGDPFFLGFVAGNYRPPAGERIDPLLAQFASSLPDDGRPHAETYAFAMFSKRMTDARLRELEMVGARVLSMHPYYCVKLALAPQLIDRIAALDFVRWIGVPREWQKVQPRLVEELGRVQEGERVAVYVNVFDSDLCASSTSRAVGHVSEADPRAVVTAGSNDALPRVWLSNGWQQKQLEALGLHVVEYIDGIRAFRAELDPAQLEALVALDFVQFVEADLPMTSCHDESMACISADRTRQGFNGGTNLAGVVGEIDSGVDIAHAALDPFIVGWDFTAQNWGPFNDGDGHGSHVCGTILGNGDVEDSYQGAAPGLGSQQDLRFFIAKLFDSTGSSSGVDYSALLGAMHSSYIDNGGHLTPHPMVVNNSYGAAGTFWTGTEATCRELDDEVYDHNELFVFAAGNEGPALFSLREQAASKNVLTVGNVYDFESSNGDPGVIVDGSSRGPCADGRWKPNVCAPGALIRSVLAGSTNGYVDMSGTSMASPHVVGVSAQLLDHYSFLRYNPEVLSAVLMAGAMTKSGQLLTDPSTDFTHLNSYGTGRIEAYKSHWGDSQEDLFFWSASLAATDSTHVQLPINAGATRVTFVVRYIEPSASSGASQALRNDFDMYLDAAPFLPLDNMGDYTAQQSNVDNTEVRSFNNPTVADWRIKIAPVSTFPGDVVKVGICAIVTYGDTTPNPTFSVTTNSTYVKPGDSVTLTASYTNPDYIASAVFLDSTSSGDALTASYGTLSDGSTTDWTSNHSQAGRDVLIGDVIHGVTKTVHWKTSWNTEGQKSWSVNARSDNAVDKTDAVTIYVDGTAPGTASNLHSTTHTPNVWSNDTSIHYDWNAATDNLSGVDGYGLGRTASPSLPGATLDTSATGWSQTLPDGSWYFNVRSVDRSGNWDNSYVSTGPYLIDTVDPSIPASMHSTTHTVGVQSCSTSVGVVWHAATDADSGLAGYIAVWNTSPSTIPTGATNIAASATSLSQTLSSNNTGRYFHLRAVDHAGNLGVTVHLGPIFANANSVSSYCTGKTNSLGCVPAIGSSGMPSKGSGNFTVTCGNVINQKNGLLFWGHTSVATPFQGGTLCVGAPTVRTPNVSSGGATSGSSCTGIFAFAYDTAYMNALSIQPGDTLFAQWWMRDPASASTTGLSNALQFTICE